MKKYLILISLFAGSVIAFGSPETDAIKTKETAAWQAYKDKDAAGFQKLLSPEMRAVYDTGINTLQTELANMQKTDLKSFTMSDFNAVAIAPDTIISTYKMTTQGSMEGKDISGNLNVASVWRKMNGEWRAIFHTDAKQAAAMP